MEIKVSRVQFALLSLWLGGLLLCLSISFAAREYFEPGTDFFDQLFNNVLDTFSPQLATMLAFLFSDQMTAQKKHTARMEITVLALFLSLVYVGLFCGLLLAFQFDWGSWKAVEVISLFKMVRPKATFFVTASIAYFFAARR